MAQVKFYQGLQSAAASNPEGSIGFLNKADAAAGYIYLGNNMVATKYLKELDLTGFAAGAGLLEIGTSSSNPILTTRSLITATSSTYSWSSNDNVPTAKVIADFVSKQQAANDIYHKTGTWGSSTNWNVYTAKCYKGTSEVASGATGYQELKFTLPISTATGSSYASDSTHLTTPKQVADYIGQLAGAMEYKGELTTAMYTTHPAYEPGDVFIAKDANSTLGIEVGDMVIVNTAMAANAAFVTSGTGKNCDVFERNIDGAVTAGNDLGANMLILGNSNKTIKTLSTHKGAIIYSSDADTIGELLISATTGQHLVVKSTGLPGWENSQWEHVAQKANTGSGSTLVHNEATLVITDHENTTTSSREITIDYVAHATQAESATSADSATNATYVGMSESSDTSTPILVRGAKNGQTTNYGVKYDSQITVNASTNTLNAAEVVLNGGTSTSVSVYDTLIWHTLS
jgi:hypothetical protein